MRNRILVALDGSARSERSLPWVRLLGEGADITLFRAVEPAYGLDVYAAEVIRELWGEAEQYLLRVAKKFDPMPETIAEVGSSAGTILKAARKRKADLVVVTTHGGSTVLRRTIGGTTEKLLHGSDVPLLVVPSWVESPPPARVKRIVVPLDGSEPSERILPYALKLATELDAELLLVHALMGADAELIGESPQHKEAEFLKALKRVIVEQWEQIEQRLRNDAKRIEKSGVKARMILQSGDAPEVILKAVREEGADLIAMSAHGYGAMKRLLLGSVASKVIRASPVPVLVAKFKALAPEHPGTARRAVAQR